MKKLLIALLLWPAVAMAQYPVPRFPGSYPVPSSLTGSERIFATSGQNVINILPSQLSQYVASTAVFGGSSLVTLGPILGTSNNMYGANGVYIGNGNINQYNPFAYGWGNTATGAFVSVNIPVGGIANANGAGDPAIMFPGYSGADTVGLATASFSRSPMITVTPVTFDATHVYFSPSLTQAQVAQLRLNQFINTNDSTIYRGMIGGWAADGSSITVVKGWYLSPGATGEPPGIPAGNTVYINPTTTNFALSVTCGTNGAGHLITAGQDIIDANCQEIDSENFTGSYDSTRDYPSVTALSLNAGYPTNCNLCGTVSRAINIYGDYYDPIMIHSARDTAIWYIPDTPALSWANSARFLLTAQTAGIVLEADAPFTGTGFFIPNVQSGGIPLAFGTAGSSWFGVSSDGGLRMGQVGSSATIAPFIDLNFKNTTAAGYQARFQLASTSDPTTTGGGDLIIWSRDLITGDNVLLSPSATNGFFYVAGVNGTPTGSPANADGAHFPMVWNVADHKLCVYDGGVWHDAVGGTGC